MKDPTENSKQLSEIEEKLHQHFDYLFQRGFAVASKEYYPQYMGNWTITLLSLHCDIEFMSDRGEIFLSIGSIKMDMWFDLPTAVYYVTNGDELIGNFEGELREKDAQFARLANILKTHIEQILGIFQSLEKYESDLLSTRRIVRDLYLEQHLKRNKSNH